MGHSPRLRAQDSLFLLRALVGLGHRLARGIIGADDQVAVIDSPGFGARSLGIIKDVVVFPALQGGVGDSVGVRHIVDDVAGGVDAGGPYYRGSRDVNRRVLLAVVEPGLYVAGGVCRPCPRALCGLSISRRGVRKSRVATFNPRELCCFEPGIVWLFIICALLFAARSDRRVLS
jgi:hypothetical protein